jgi:hypothetical protein
MKPAGQTPDKRLEPRATKLSNHRAEFKFTGVPVYHLKVRDLSAKGAGIVVRADSNFLEMVQIGQQLDVNLISHGESAGPSGHYKSRIEHVSELKEGRFRGHMVVGLSLLNRLR